MKNKKLIVLGALAASTATASAVPPTATEIATQLTDTISTYGGALTAVVIAGVVMRFVWKWIKSVR